MGNFGIRISEEGYDVNTTPTSTNKKNFTFLSDDSSPKVLYAGFLTGTGSGISYTHSLGYVPMFFLFQTDSSTTPTYFLSASGIGTSTTTTISCALIELGYLIILNEGN